MIASLDSSFFRPSRDIAMRAKAAGVTNWSGYLATRPGVKLASPWDQASFENARLCGSTPIAYASGWDDPGACKKLAEAWNVRLCLDVESGIRALSWGFKDLLKVRLAQRGERRLDGDWVQPWLDAAGCGLYGNAPVFRGRHAAFYILAGYPGADPRATWRGPRPAGPCGWQWQGTHNEFGGGVDRSWLDDWFAGVQPPPPKRRRAMVVGTPGPDRHGAKGACYLVLGPPVWLGTIGEVNDWLHALNQSGLIMVGQYPMDRLLDRFPEGQGLQMVSEHTQKSARSDFDMRPATPQDFPILASAHRP